MYSGVVQGDGIGEAETAGDGRVVSVLVEARTAGFCYFLVVWSGMVCRRSRGRRGRTEIYILRWLFDGIHNGYSHGYCFMIQDTESSADIICFKPDPVIGNVEKMYTEERSLPPATCKVRILDRKLSTDMQKEVVDVSVSE